MIIRKIQIEDAAAFIQLDVALSTETDFMLRTVDEAKFMAVVEQEMIIQTMHLQESNMIFVAEVDGKIIGFIGLMRGFCGAIYGKVEMAMGVKKSHQCLGIGRKLLANAEIWLTENHCYRWELNVHTTNEAAIALYQSHGFEMEGTRRNFCLKNGEFADVHMMAKLLG
jgi:ribosomal protein S18 acetylase RimI-like enzyme